MIIYKTTNLVNGKIYVGRQLHDNPNYIGSGKIMQRAIEKYGRVNFKKEILEVCSSVAELNTKEQFWIHQLNSTDKDIGYNIMTGGQGGNHYNYKHGIEHHSFGKPQPKHVGEAVAKSNAARTKSFGEDNKSYKSIDNNVKKLILQLSSDGLGRDKIYVRLSDMGIHTISERTITRRLNEWKGQSV